MSSLEDISKKIQNLEGLVEKQSKVIATTGQKLLEIQVKDVKSRMAQIDSGSGSNTSNQFDAADYIGNDDIVQLVTELQSQLDNLEDRATRRTYNSTLTEDEQKLAPLSNRDGDEPSFALPSTIKEFKTLSKARVLELGVFYEIILPNEEEISEVLEKDSGNSKNDIIDLAKNKDISKLEDQFSNEQVDEVFDELARYFGIRYRRVSNGW
ncbi:MRP8 [Candida margitis]|uniref:MRP8 n=1 Tax=Candida margitis TaxID=1775924 RepID=UPI0022262898|nr:MRP8 [Candida margitis]KAI5967857.1 MRP8 [Candida margitis]